MSRSFLLLATLSICAALVGGLAPPAEGAQLLTIRQAAAACPDFRGAKACRSVAETFLNGRQPGADTDAQIANLAASISNALQSRQAPPVVCRDAARGIRVLVEGVTNRETIGKLRQLASRLCADPEQAGPKGNLFQVPQSLSSGQPNFRRRGDSAPGDNAGDLAPGDSAGDVAPGDNVAGDVAPD